MTTNGKQLLAAVDSLWPGYSTLADWGDVWQRPLATGSALEWSTLGAVAASAKAEGWDVDFPLLERDFGKSLFTMYNRIPRQHRAQAGHAAHRSRGGEIVSHFLQALTPKVVLRKGKETYSIFREGCPYHMIAAGHEYEERPDIILMPGSVPAGYPRVREDGRSIDFAYDIVGERRISGVLLVVDSPKLPLENKIPLVDFALPVAGILECSTNKPGLIILRQLPKYERLFINGRSAARIGLVLGNAVEELRWPQYRIDLESAGKNLADQLAGAGHAALAGLGIL